MPHSSKPGRALLRAALLVIPLLGALGPAAWAQTFYGSMVGTVSDPSGGLAPGVQITITNLGTGETRVVETNEAGLYRALNLLPGSYRVEGQLAGFKQFRREPVPVEVQSNVRIDVVLEVGEVTETVEVVAEAPLLQSQSGSLGQVVESRKVVELPLNGRNVLNLAALAPGVVPQGQAEGTPVGKNIFAWGNYAIGGGQANQSATTVDGVPVNVPYINLTALIPTQDSIQEFKIETNNLGAEFGRFAGGVINLTTRSGSNEFHGSVYHFLRNRELNANPFFNNARGVARPPFTQNQYGGNLGGPVVKNKLFFFGSFEGFRQRQGRSFVGSVPTPQMLEGDFSAFAERPIHDPFSITSSEQLRTPFPNNRVPQSMVNPVARRMIPDIWPAANLPGLVNNFATNMSGGGDQDQFSGRADYTASDKHRVFGRWTNWHQTNIGQSPFGTLAHLDQGPEDSTTNQIVFADTYLFSPTLILDVRAGYLRFRYDRTPNSLGIAPSAAGLPSDLDNQVVFRHFPYPLVLEYEIGSGTGSIIRARNETYTLTPSLTWVKGRHTVKMGADIRRLIHNYGQSNNPSGSFNFNPDFTASNPINPVGGIGFASFLLGTGSGGGIGSPALVAGQKIYRAAYVNDTWQATQRLTVNLGLRWEVEGPFSERFDRMSSFIADIEHPFAAASGLPLRGNLVLVDTPANPSRNNQDTDNLFSPRVGFAYRLTDRTVIRGGYGLFWLPSDVSFWLAPNLDALNNISTPWVTTRDGGVSPFRLLDNPFPDGVLQPGRRDEELLLGLTGLTARAPFPGEPYSYTQQWNFNIQQQLPDGTLLDIAYAGNKGTNLPTGTQQMNQLPDEFLSLGSALLDRVPNPFFGSIQTGPLAGETVTRGQLLRPFPQFDSVLGSSQPNRDSTFHSMQFKAEKRLADGASILAAYTVSKTMTNAQTLTGWLEASAAGRNGNNNNLTTMRGLANFDVSQRLVVSYVIDLPFGAGRRLGSGATGFTKHLISGWGLNGVTTLQKGFPVVVSPQRNLSNSFGGSQNIANNGQDPELTGRAQDRLNRWFDTSTFSQPAAFTFGNTSPVLPNVRGHGVANFDFAVFKNSDITERLKLQFRTEFFNIFNRAQFGQPNGRQGTANFGVVTQTVNEPRLVQFGLRLMF